MISVVTNASVGDPAAPGTAKIRRRKNAAQPPSANQVKRCQHPHGNFPDFERTGPRMLELVEPRVERMPDDWFRGKDCLDIGCGFGFVALTIGSVSFIFRAFAHKPAGRLYSPRRMDGVDIDGRLVASAYRSAGIAQARQQRRQGPRFPASFPICLGPPAPPADPAAFPSNVHFERQDFVAAEDCREAAYDTILWCAHSARCVA